MGSAPYLWCIKDKHMKKTSITPNFVAFRNYRTYLLNIAVSTGDTALAVKAKLASTKELRVMFNEGFKL